MTGRWERRFILQMFPEKHDCSVKKKKNFPKVTVERFAAPARFSHLCRFPSINVAVWQVKPALCRRACDKKTQVCSFSKMSSVVVHLFKLGEPVLMTAANFNNLTKSSRPKPQLQERTHALKFQDEKSTRKRTHRNWSIAPHSHSFLRSLSSYTSLRLTFHTLSSRPEWEGSM